MTDPKTTVAAALAREAREAARGDRDARQDIERIVVRRHARIASPAGLASLFPALKAARKKD